MSALQLASSKLDALFAVIDGSPKLEKDSQLFLNNQAMIYANYLSAAIAGRITQTAESQSAMVEMINAFCNLVNTELASTEGVSSERA